jgi:hypothetical protein
MTNLNAANIGMNKYCGPAVLSILSGKSTDECARVISRINGQYRVEGVQLNHLLMALDKLGFDQMPVNPANSLFATLCKIANNDGLYIVTVTGHYVAVEVQDKKIYFCDNHTKEPIPAASSARLQMKVLATHKIVKRPEVVIPKPEPTPEVVDVATPIKILTYKQAVERIQQILALSDTDHTKLVRIETVISMINEE